MRDLPRGAARRDCSAKEFVSRESVRFKILWRTVMGSIRINRARLGFRNWVEAERVYLAATTL